MCGFVGIVSPRGVDESHRRAIDDASTSIRHRGPDSAGVVSTRFAHISFRRLSVVDLDGGHQPLSNEDGSVQVFLNGEIFNHRDLRRELLSRGHDLRTQSDTEVLPHLWEDHGPALLSRLNGMFALCIVDHRRREVFLARDRIGIKPLFVAETRFGTIFGSELKALLATGLVPRNLEREAALRFVDTLSSGGRTTLVRGVERLLPGEALHLTGDQTGHRYRWYDLPEELAARPGPSEPGEVLDLLRDAVSLQLNADVPVGISLSGGVDSTFLALMAREAGHEDVAAFTVDFADAPDEEVASARAVASSLGLQHEVLRSTTGDFVREAPFVVWTSDEPVADPAYYPALKVAEAASRSVTVLLAGSGADELFAGYGHYRLSKRRRLAARLLSDPGRRVPHLLARALDLSGAELGGLRSYRSSPFAWHAYAMTHLEPDERSTIETALDGAHDPVGLLRDAFDMHSGGTALQQQLLADTLTYLPDQLLPLLDRTTMAYSVEGRVPFLDHRVVEAGLGLPDGSKLGRRGTKLLLRRAMDGKVPDLVLRRSKLGFPNAVRTWLRGELAELLPSILGHPDGVLRDLFPGPWLDGLLLDRHAAPARWPVVYALLTLEIWHRIFIVEGWDRPPLMSLAELYPPRVRSMAG